MSSTTVMMPDLLITHDPTGRQISEVVGVERPLLLAKYAQGLDRTGASARALLIKASLVADGRCADCGRRLSSRSSLANGYGPDCGQTRS